MCTILRGNAEGRGRCAKAVPAIVALAFSILPACADTSCKSSLLGLCITRYTSAEQVKIDDAAASQLVLRLRRQVRLNNSLLFIKDDQFLTTFPATVNWSIECLATGVFVNFGDTSQDGSGVILDLTENGGVDYSNCNLISGRLGAAIQEITRGQ